MAIKVIKHGQKPKFKKTCPNCGCVFEYEVEDLQIEQNWSLNSYTYPAHKKRVVVCPDCGEKVYHDSIIDDIYPTYPNVIYCNTPTYTETLDCDKCPNKPDPNKIVVGDTPCTWCKKNMPYCTVASSVDGNFNTNVANVKIDPELYKNTATTYTDFKVDTDYSHITSNYTTDIENK